jgi:hypothetical protein
MQEAGLEDDEKLSQLDRLQIPKEIMLQILEQIQI